MIRKPNSLLSHLLDESTSLPTIHWETVPPGVKPERVWTSYDTSVEGWVPVWFPTHDPEIGIAWPLDKGVAPLLSEKDKKGLLLKDAEIFP